MSSSGIRQIIADWQLGTEGPLLGRIERMIEPSLLAGHFGSSPTLMISGLQYHLGGTEDTRQLAALSDVGSRDHILDVACFLGGPALQLATSYGCRVTGIDISDIVIIAARRIAALAGLERLLEYQVADAGALPFADDAFTVVWNQGSLAHDACWLAEFDRVLQPDGRLALVFEILPADTPRDGTDARWRLSDVSDRVRNMGYRIDDISDLTERDITLGWEALIERARHRHEIYSAAFGPAWLEAAIGGFQAEIEAMRAGQWSNGRLIATKLGA